MDDPKTGVAILCAIILLVVTVILIIRDYYIKYNCEKKLYDLVRQLNSVNSSKFGVDKNQFNQLNELEDRLSLVQKNYVSKEEIAKEITTNNINAQRLVARNISANDLTATSIQYSPSALNK